MHYFTLGHVFNGGSFSMFGFDISCAVYGRVLTKSLQLGAPSTVLHTLLTEESGDSIGIEGCAIHSAFRRGK